MIIKQKTIEKLALRDEDAFERVYAQTKKGVYIVIYNIVKDYELTQDLMQDVYLLMLDKIDKYKPQTNFYNWLLMIAKNKALDTYRRNQKLTYIDDVDYDQKFTSIEEDPSQKDEFESLLSVLSDDERQIILFKIVDDMKHKDIAKLVDKPLGTVIWIYHEALKKMKKGWG
ncbi:MAG: sigma-70 family RNA polymerase sigma factor [Acholeplasmataceae bacterium]|nr:sigma-70 family RNA polymerase sigma factor [Acholeplasmataceae bacterium]